MQDKKYISTEVSRKIGLAVNPNFTLSTFGFQISYYNLFESLRLGGVCRVRSYCESWDLVSK